MITLPRSRLAAEHRCVVGQPGGRKAISLSRFMEGLNYVSGFDGVEADRGQNQARVVVDQVEDLDFAAIGEQPMGRVGLPHLVR
jgi:hypothetical protein